MTEVVIPSVVQNVPINFRKYHTEVTKRFLTHGGNLSGKKGRLKSDTDLQILREGHKHSSLSYRY